MLWNECAQLQNALVAVRPKSCGESWSAGPTFPTCFPEWENGRNAHYLYERTETTQSHRWNVILSWCKTFRRKRTDLMFLEQWRNQYSRNGGCGGTSTFSRPKTMCKIGRRPKCFTALYLVRCQHLIDLIGPYYSLPLPPTAHRFWENLTTRPDPNMGAVSPPPPRAPVATQMFWNANKI